MGKANAFYSIHRSRIFRMISEISVSKSDISTNIETFDIEVLFFGYISKILITESDI